MADPAPQHEPTPPPSRPTVCACAEECLATLLQNHTTPQPEAALRSSSGWTVLVVAYPTPETPEFPLDLTECDTACLALLAQVDVPLPGSRIHTELEERNLGIFGAATVKRSLARLVQRGLIRNSRTRPRGYLLPEALPLFRPLLTDNTATDPAA